MDPSHIAYQTQLQFNRCLADVYIKARQGFDSTTGALTGSSPTLVRAIQVVKEPQLKKFQSGPGGSYKIWFGTVITFPRSFLGSAVLKLNDFVTLYPSSGIQRYEVKDITQTASLLTLGLVEYEGQMPQIIHTINISDVAAWTDAATEVIE